MISLSTALSFFVTAVVLGLAPGPDNLYVLGEASRKGAGAGIAVTCGLCIGIAVHTFAVAVGLAAVFASSAGAFTAVQVFGAGYLLYLAWQAVSAQASELTATGAQQDRTRQSHRSLVLKGLVLNLSNPKVALFFLALLPQFADPARGSLPVQFAQLGALFIVATLIVFGSVALGGAALGQQLRARPRTMVWLNRVSGAVFVLLALALLASTGPG